MRQHLKEEYCDAMDEFNKDVKDLQDLLLQFPKQAKREQHPRVKTRAKERLTRDWSITYTEW